VVGTVVGGKTYALTDRELRPRFRFFEFALHLSVSSLVCLLLFVAVIVIVVVVVVTQCCRIIYLTFLTLGLQLTVYRDFCADFCAIYKLPALFVNKQKIS